MLASDDVGNGSVVVLLHAGVADRSMWSEHLQPLADAGFRALAVDLPGFGEAPVAHGAQEPWSDVLATMDELSIDQATLVGSSFGAAVALRVALVAPARVSALVLVSAPAPGLEPSSELRAAWDAEEAALERGDVEAAVQAVVDAWTMPGATPALRERVAAMQSRAFELQSEATTAIEAPDPIEQDPGGLARIDVRALVAAGEHDMADFLEGAEMLARTLPRAQHAVIARAGHLAPLESPEAFQDLLLEFLRS